MRTRHAFRCLSTLVTLVILLSGLAPDSTAGPAEPAASAPASTGRVTSIVPPPPQAVERMKQEGRPLPDLSRYKLSPTPIRPRPLQGSVNLLVVLVYFVGTPGTVTNLSLFNNLVFNPPVSGRGSVRDYYDEVTRSTVTIANIPAELPSATGWRNSNNTMAYFANGQYGMRGPFPQNAGGMVSAVLPALDPLVNFANYDNDGDGQVDTMLVIHAGTGAEWSFNVNHIWSHASSITLMGGTPPTLDGVLVDRYVTVPEYWEPSLVGPGATDMTIGVMCHEIAHGLFGLPDLYDLDLSSNGIGQWGLMSYGDWNGPAKWNSFLGYNVTDGSSPAWPEAWSRIVMGADSYQMILQPGAITLPRVLDNPNSIRRFKTSSLQTPEYFLLENRQRVGGSYDEYLPAAGLLIWHVDELKWLWGQDNRLECTALPHCSGSCQVTHYLVALEQADGLDELEKAIDRGDDGDPFPGTANRTSWRPYLANPVNPESDSWYAQGCNPSSCIDVTNIACTTGSNCTAMVNSAVCNLVEADLGDAPASQNHSGAPMTAYHAGGALPQVSANYPTVYLAQAAPGPRHHIAARDIYLGTAVTSEYDADLMPDLDNLRNISPTLDLADMDSINSPRGSDDGLTPLLILARCKPMALPITVTAVSQGPILPRYINAWIDANRDGDWADTLLCPDGTPAAEWIVGNQSFVFNPGVYPSLPVGAFFPPFAVVKDAPWEAWLRIGIAEMPAPAPYDGRGPATGYDLGETEDYFLTLFPGLGLVANVAGKPIPGDLVTYTIQLSAQGNVAVVDAVLSDPLPSELLYLHSTPPGNYDPAQHEITWTAGLWPNAPLTIQVVTQLLADAEPCERITNSVSLSWGTNLWKDAAAGFDEGCPAGDPHAAFTHTTPACLGAPVAFTNQSGGTIPLTYAWDLDGDGLVDSTAEHPTWDYAAAADYTVALTASNCCGDDVATATVSVLQPLQGVAVSGPAGLLVGEVGTYTAVPTPPGASNPAYAWDNGTTGITTTYSWAGPGLYTIVVTGSNACGEETGAMEVLVSDTCISLTGVTIAGPNSLQVGEEGVFTASPQPPTATNPAYLWSNGAVGAGAVYSWTAPGVYDVQVTASNCQGVAVSDTASVVVTSGCVSLTAVTIAGPAALLPGEEGAFTAAPTPPTATNPVYLWSNGRTGPSTTYSWPVAGDYTVTVTATNCLGMTVRDDFGVVVRSEFRIYLPLVLRSGS